MTLAREDARAQWGRGGAAGLCGGGGTGKAGREGGKESDEVVHRAGGALAPSLT
jgi:hypothetical protein